MKKQNFSFGWVIFWAIVAPPIAILYLAYKLHNDTRK